MKTVDKAIKEIVYKHGMKTVLQSLIKFTDELFLENKEKYLNELSMNLQKTLSDYEDWYKDEN